MSDESVILINLLKVKPEKRDALIALLKQNTDTVIRTLPGWKTTRLIAAKDGGDRKPRRFTSNGRASSSKTPAGAISPHRQTAWRRTEPSRRSLVLVGVWKRTPPTRQREGEIAEAHQPRFAPELRRIGVGT